MRELPHSQCYGDPCRACGRKVRYIATGKCVACFRRQQREHYYREITPAQGDRIIGLFLDEGWSVFEICRRTHRAAEPVKAYLVGQGLLPRDVLGRTVSTCSRGGRALVYGADNKA